MLSVADSFYTMRWPGALSGAEPGGRILTSLVTPSLMSSYPVHYPSNAFALLL